MKNLIVFLMSFAVLAASSGVAQNRLTSVEKKEGYVLLFNGKNLDGWQGDPDRWSVQDGNVVGSNDGKPFNVNTLVIYKRPFANLVLKGGIKLRNHNSGIQFRSEQLPGEGWILNGYQGDASEVGEEVGVGQLLRRART